MIIDFLTKKSANSINMNFYLVTKILLANLTVNDTWEGEWYHPKPLIVKKDKCNQYDFSQMLPKSSFLNFKTIFEILSVGACYVTIIGGRRGSIIPYTRNT